MSAPWFPKRWPPTMPDAIQYYGMNTPNGVKVSVCLEEMGLTYEPHVINITRNDQFDPDFLRLSPNGKIPALLDPRGPEGQPVMLMESVVILQYLAEKTGMLFPPTYRARLEAQQWLVFQAAHIGPMFGQFGHFHVFAKGKTDDYGDKRYTAECKRLLGVLNERLKDREYLMGDYSIVDIAHVPWLEGTENFYKARDHLEMPSFTHVQRWREAVRSRPAYVRGKDVAKLG
jgi:GSH-dependent disulfide-bond oxidoreductase